MSAIAFSNMLAVQEVLLWLENGRRVAAAEDACTEAQIAEAEMLLESLARPARGTGQPR